MSHTFLPLKKCEISTIVFFKFIVLILEVVHSSGFKVHFPAVNDRKQKRLHAAPKTKTNCCFSTGHLRLLTNVSQHFWNVYFLLYLRSQRVSLLVCSKCFYSEDAPVPADMGEEDIWRNVDCMEHALPAKEEVENKTRFFQSLCISINRSCQTDK